MATRIERVGLARPPRRLQAAWRAGEADPLDARRHDPAFALPVYTRLSDAEENERIRLAKNDPKKMCIRDRWWWDAASSWASPCP